MEESVIPGEQLMSIRRYRLNKCFVPFLCVLMCAGLLWADVNHDVTDNGENSIWIALRNYYIDYGAFPAGKNIDIIHALVGANSHKVVYIQWPKKDTDVNGRFLDLWGTPYDIKFFGENSVEIRSAGGDKQFGTQDDVVLTKTVKW